MRILDEVREASLKLFSAPLTPPTTTGYARLGLGVDRADEEQRFLDVQRINRAIPRTPEYLQRAWDDAKYGRWSRNR